MILLDGHSLTPARRVPLEAMSLSLKERDSTATITPADMGGIKIKSWMQDDTNPGKGMVWRVRSMKTAYNTNTVTLQLEHIINSLKDIILFGETKTETLAGEKGAKTVKAKKAVQYILGKQDDWVLGRFDFDDSNPYKFDGETLFDALVKITDSLENAMWTYNTTVYPFKLNIIQAPEDVDSVLRASRNLKTISKNVDKTGMFTRFYPIGKDDLHLPDGGYVEKNTGKYGTVSKVEVDQTLDSVEELRRWGKERLKKHAEPVVTIEAEGFELAEDTGEPLDKLTLGRICMIPLPEFDETIKERITALAYNDKIHNPQTVKITLANNKTDVTKIIAEAMKKGGGGGRASEREKKEDHAWFEDTNNHVAMCAKGIVGVDSTGEANWERLSQIIVNENGIESTVKSIQEDLEIASTAIRQNEEAIELEAKRAAGAEGELEGRIKVQADRISLVVTKKNGQDVVDAANIVLGINDQTGSFIKLQARVVDLGNYATVGQLDAVSGNFEKLVSGDTTATWLKASSMATSSFSINTGGSFMYRGYTYTAQLLQYKGQDGTNKELYVLGRSAG